MTFDWQNHESSREYAKWPEEIQYRYTERAAILSDGQSNLLTYGDHQTARQEALKFCIRNKTEINAMRKDGG